MLTSRKQGSRSTTRQFTSANLDTGHLGLIPSNVLSLVDGRHVITSAQVHVKGEFALGKTSFPLVDNQDGRNVYDGM
jgi:hypothetical protein